MKLKTTTLFPLILLVILFLPSCVSLVNYQTGKTLGKGRKELLVYKEYLAVVKKQSISDGNDIGEILNGGVGVRVRYGFEDRLDLGLQLSTTTEIGVNAKFSLINPLSSKYGLALAPRVSTNLLGSIFIDVFNIEVEGLYSAVVPLIFSYHPNKKWAFILSEQYSVSGLGVFDNPFSHAFSIEYGDEHFKILGGVTYQYTNSINVFYTGIGTKFYFGKSKSFDTNRL